MNSILSFLIGCVVGYVISIVIESKNKKQRRIQDARL